MYLIYVILMSWSNLSGAQLCEIIYNRVNDHNTYDRSSTQELHSSRFQVEKPAISVLAKFTPENQEMIKKLRKLVRYMERINHLKDHEAFNKGITYVAIELNRIWDYFYINNLKILSLRQKGFVDENQMKNMQQTMEILAEFLALILMPKEASLNEGYGILKMLFKQRYEDEVRQTNELKKKMSFIGYINSSESGTNTYDARTSKLPYIGFIQDSSKASRFIDDYSSSQKLSSIGFIQNVVDSGVVNHSLTKEQVTIKPPTVYHSRKKRGPLGFISHPEDSSSLKSYRLFINYDLKNHQFNLMGHPKIGF